MQPVLVNIENKTAIIVKKDKYVNLLLITTTAIFLIGQNLLTWQNQAPINKI